MKKIIFTLAILFVFSLATQPVFSTSLTTYNPGYTNYNDSSKDEKVQIISNGPSGEMHLRFTTAKAGRVKVKILNEAGKMMFKQTCVVTHSINFIPLRKAAILPEGTYTLHVSTDHESHTTTFLIWK